MLGNVVTSSAVQSSKNSTRTSSTQAKVGQSAGGGCMKDRRLTVGGSQAQLLQGKVETQFVNSHWGCKPTAAP